MQITKVIIKMIKVITKYWLVQVKNQYGAHEWMVRLQYEYQDNNYKIIPKTKDYETKYFPLKEAAQNFLNKKFDTTPSNFSENPNSEGGAPENGQKET